MKCKRLHIVDGNGMPMQGVTVIMPYGEKTTDKNGDVTVKGSPVTPVEIVSTDGWMTTHAFGDLSEVVQLLPPVFSDLDIGESGDDLDNELVPADISPATKKNMLWWLIGSLVTVFALSEKKQPKKSKDGSDSDKK